MSDTEVELDKFKTDCLGLLNPAGHIDPNELVSVSVWGISAALANVFGSKASPLMENSSKVFDELKKIASIYDR